eukprot:COSAG05_NODE_1716_length_4226_cov_89.636298_2_plen_81_part_00
MDPFGHGKQEVLNPSATEPTVAPPSLGGSGYVPSDSYSLSPAGAVASARVPSTALGVAAQVTFCGKRINSSVGKAVAGLL